MLYISQHFVFLKLTKCHYFPLCYCPPGLFSWKFHIHGLFDFFPCNAPCAEFLIDISTSKSVIQKITFAGCKMIKCQQNAEGSMQWHPCFTRSQQSPHRQGQYLRVFLPYLYHSRTIRHRWMLLLDDQYDISKRLIKSTGNKLRVAVN